MITNRDKFKIGDRLVPSEYCIKKEYEQRGTAVKVIGYIGLQNIIVCYPNGNTCEYHMDWWQLDSPEPFTAKWLEERALTSLCVRE